jgi:hypothetical protein
MSNLRRLSEIEKGRAAADAKAKDVEGVPTTAVLQTNSDRLVGMDDVNAGVVDYGDGSWWSRKMSSIKNSSFGQACAKNAFLSKLTYVSGPLVHHCFLYSVSKENT